MDQLKSLVEAIKEGSKLFNGFFDGILKLLPTSWATFVKTALLVATVVLGIPIVFVMIVLTFKCISLLWWCYAPLLSRILHLARGIISFSLRVFRAVGNLFRRTRRSVQNEYRLLAQNEPIRVSQGEHLQQQNIEIQPRRLHSRVAKAASKAL